MQPKQNISTVCEEVNEFDIENIDVAVCRPYTPPSIDIVLPPDVLPRVNQQLYQDGSPGFEKDNTDYISESTTKESTVDESHINNESETPESRRYRTAFTKKQLNRLEKEFLRQHYISKPKRCQLATDLDLSESTIKVWFQNRRMKEKRNRSGIMDPALAAYMQAAASGYVTLLSTASPWSSPGYLGLNTPQPLPYSAHAGHGGVLNHVTTSQFSPYLRTPSPALFSTAPAMTTRNHFSSCPADLSPKEPCSCVSIYSSTLPGSTAAYHPGLCPSYQPALFSSNQGIKWPMSPSGNGDRKNPKSTKLHDTNKKKISSKLNNSNSTSFRPYAKEQMA